MGDIALSGSIANRYSNGSIGQFFFSIRFNVEINRNLNEHIRENFAVAYALFNFVMILTDDSRSY